MDHSNLTIDEIDAYFEAEYIEFKKKSPKYHFIYWEDKDETRYFNEILNRIDEENKKPMVYPEISVKIFQILSIIIFLYLSNPDPNKWICLLVTLTSIGFVSCALIRENNQNDNGYRPVMTVDFLYQKLDCFISGESNQKINKRSKKEKIEREKVKLRILALDNGVRKWNTFFLILDILSDLLLIAVTIFALNRRVQNGTHIFLDAAGFILGCGHHIAFSVVYLLTSFENWNWLRTAKSKLLNSSALQKYE
ncbi:unnamed protein product [Caenorhabditis brenneri]